MFLTTRPSPERIDRFIRESRTCELSYNARDLVGTGAPGFHTDELTTAIGNGRSDYDRARDALRTWRHFELGWVECFPKGAPVEPGTVVAILIRHLGFWSLNGCRVVSETSSDGLEYGFTYGSLTTHAERGEELFSVRLDPMTGRVSYSVRAVSQPRAFLAKLGFPLARYLQWCFRRDSTAAMQRALRP